MNSIKKPPRGALSFGQLIAFGFPAMTHALIASPVYAILPSFYAAKTAVTLAQIGLIAALCRIVDAICDPITGYLSDRTRTRFGSRKPWIVLSIGFCGVAVFQLFRPPGDATWIYYLVWSQILFFGFTMFEVPRSAWGAEISREYNERATVGMYVGGFNIAGSLAFYLLPLVVGLITGQSRIDGQTLRIIAWTYVIAMPLGIMASAILVPQGDGVDLKTVSIRAVVKTLATVRPVQRHLAALFLWGLGQGIVLGGAFIFYSDYMKMDAYFALIMGLLFLTQVASLPVWSRFLPRFDRHRVWACCVAGGALLGPLVLLIPKGQHGLVPALGLILMQGVLMAPGNVLPGAILGDVIDFDTLKSGTNKAGNLFAVQMVLIKVAMALGGGFAFDLLAVVGYHVGKTNSHTAELGLIATFIFVPACFHLAMAALVWNFPITRHRQIIIYRRLQRARQAA